MNEAVADEGVTKESDVVSAKENPEEANRRISESKKLSPIQKKIVDLFNHGLPSSIVIRKLGMQFGKEGHEYMSKEEFKHQLDAIRTIADEEGIVYRKKQERNGEDGEVRNGTEEIKDIILSKSNDIDISKMSLTEKAKKQAEALEILERLAGRNITNRETEIKAQINSTQRNKLVSRAALSKSQKNGFSFEDHFLTVANIDKLFENGNLVNDRDDRKNDPNVLSVKRFVAPVFINNDFAEAYMTVKETAGSKLYSLELDKLKKPSDITGGTLNE